VDIPPAQMARGNSKAQSELPSGVEATKEDIRRLNYEKDGRERASKYLQNFEKESGYKSIGNVNVGDGEVGNGIIKNGVLFLRDEDIAKIVKENVLDSKAVKDMIGEGGGLQPFTLFVGENNKLNLDTDEAKAFNKASYTNYNHELETSPYDLPDGSEWEVTDFDAGSSRTWEDPGEDASGSISIGDPSTDDFKFHAAYERVAKMPVDFASVEKLTAAIDVISERGRSSYEEKLAENYDWSEHEQEPEYDNERDRYDD